MKTSVTDLKQNYLLFFSDYSPFTKPTFPHCKAWHHLKVEKMTSYPIRIADLL